MQRSVLLGEFDFTLDAKNRVAIPARLRPAFAEGAYLTRGFDRCLAAYPTDRPTTLLTAVSGRIVYRAGAG